MNKVQILKTVNVKDGTMEHSKCSVKKLNAAVQ